MVRGVVVLSVLTFPVLSQAHVVWRGDFETGDRSQWSNEQMVSADRLEVVQSPLREGRYALKATVRQGDDPIGASGNRNELVYHSREPVGSEYYYRWSTQFAPGYPSAPTWQLFAQWHHYGCCGSPPIQFIVNGEEMLLAGVGRTVWRAPLNRGVWNDFIFHVKWSPDPGVGFIELWHNGVLVVPKTMVATQFPDDLNYIKLGLYRSSTIRAEGVVFHDGFVMGTTLGDVLPEAPDAGSGSVDAGGPPDAGMNAGVDAGQALTGEEDAGSGADAGEARDGSVETLPSLASARPYDAPAWSFAQGYGQEPGPVQMAPAPEPLPTAPSTGATEEPLAALSSRGRGPLAAVRGGCSSAPALFGGGLGVLGGLAWRRRRSSSRR